MNFRKAKCLSSFLNMGAVILAVCMYLFTERWSVPFIILLVTLLAMVVYSVFLRDRYYRCPKCHELLPMHTSSIPTRCPKCGEKLS